MSRPTAKQIEYATELLQQLGYDPEKYDFGSRDFQEVSKLIDELKDERGY
ncbi:MAG: hypothetical protein ABFC84_18395 [Veillonellales bacterium]